MKIRFSLLCAFISFWISSPCASQNRVDYLFCDEINQSLCIYGEFSSTPGTVLIEGSPLTVLNWTDSLVTCAIPDTGTASCGHVLIVDQFGDSSNIRELSSYWFTITDNLTIMSGYQEESSENWHLRLRVDIAPSTLQKSFFSAICQSSSFYFSYQYIPSNPYSAQTLGGAGYFRGQAHTIHILKDLECAL